MQRGILVGQRNVLQRKNIFSETFQLTFLKTALQYFLVVAGIVSVILNILQQNYKNATTMKAEMTECEKLFLKASLPLFIRGISRKKYTGINF